MMLGRIMASGVRSGMWKKTNEKCGMKIKRKNSV